jgi:hypothetical protein
MTFVRRAPSCRLGPAGNVPFVPQCPASERTPEGDKDIGYVLSVPLAVRAGGGEQRPGAGASEPRSRAQTFRWPAGGKTGRSGNHGKADAPFPSLRASNKNRFFAWIFLGKIWIPVIQVGNLLLQRVGAPWT